MDSSMIGRISGGHGTFLSRVLIRLGAMRGRRPFIYMGDPTGLDRPTVMPANIFLDLTVCGHG